MAMGYWPPAAKFLAGEMKGWFHKLRLSFARSALEEAQLDLQGARRGELVVVDLAAGGFQVDHFDPNSPEGQIIINSREQVLAHAQERVSQLEELRLKVF